jgi:thioredoxin 1
MNKSAFAALSLMTASCLCLSFVCASGLTKSLSDSNIRGSSGGDEGVTETSEAKFSQDVLKASQPVFVDFYATWCGPCKILSPTVEELSKQYKGKVTFFKVDVDKNKKLAARFKIQAIPTCKIFKNGKFVDGTVGLVSAEELKGKIDKVL